MGLCKEQAEENLPKCVFHSLVAQDSPSPIKEFPSTFTFSSNVHLAAAVSSRLRVPLAQAGGLPQPPHTPSSATQIAAHLFPKDTIAKEGQNKI